MRKRRRTPKPIQTLEYPASIHESEKELTKCKKSDLEREKKSEIADFEKELTKCKKSEPKIMVDKSIANPTFSDHSSVMQGKKIMSSFEGRGNQSHYDTASGIINI